MDSTFDVNINFQYGPLICEVHLELCHREDLVFKPNNFLVLRKCRNSKVDQIHLLSLTSADLDLDIYFSGLLFWIACRFFLWSWLTDLSFCFYEPFSVILMYIWCIWKISNALMHRIASWWRVVFLFHIRVWYFMEETKVLLFFSKILFDGFIGCIIKPPLPPPPDQICYCQIFHCFLLFHCLFCDASCPPPLPDRLPLILTTTTKMFL